MANNSKAPLSGFKWTMAAVIEGPANVLTPGTVVRVTTSKGKTEDVTVGIIVEDGYEKFGLPFVKVYPAARVIVDDVAEAA